MVKRIRHLECVIAYDKSRLNINEEMKKAKSAFKKALLTPKIETYKNLTKPKGMNWQSVELIRSPNKNSQINIHASRSKLGGRISLIIEFWMIIDKVWISKFHNLVKNFFTTKKSARFYLKLVISDKTTAQLIKEKNMREKFVKTDKQMPAKDIDFKAEIENLIRENNLNPKIT